MAALPSVHYRKVVKAFISVGWQVARQRKSHIVMTKTGHIATLAVPVHNPVTLRSLIRSAGLTVDEFVSAL